MTSDHPPAEVLKRYALGRLSGEELLATDDHLGPCAACRAAVQEASGTQAPPAEWLSVLDEDHCSFEEMSGYVDGRGDADARSAMEAHLELCAMCSAEVSDLQELAVAREADRHLSYETLLRRSEGRLSGEEHERATAHLAACALCAADAKELEAADQVWRKGRRRKRMWGLSAAAAAALAIGVGVYQMNDERERPAPAAMATRPVLSMAVLPLRNATASTADDFLSIGLADAVNTRLESASSLAMRPMTSVVTIQRESGDLPATMKKLEADVVLDGQFGVEGDVVRVSWRLLDARSGNALWSESVERRRPDLLGLVAEVTARTASRLDQLPGVPDGGAVKSSDPASTSPAAFEWYLKARSLAGTLTRAGHEAQVLALRKAIELDPDFAAAHADLAIALQLGGHVRSLAGEDPRREAEHHARQAVRLDPRLASAHVALGRVLSLHPDRFPEAIREIVAALRLKPTDPHALQIMTSYFAATGDLERAQCVSDRIVRLDPLSTEAKLHGYWYIEAARPDEALRHADRALADSRTALAGHDIRGQAFILQGDLDAADREASAILQLDPTHFLGQSLKAMAAAGRGRRAEAESWLAAFEGVARRNHFAAVRVALCRAKLGDTKDALDAIERATALGHQRWYSLTRHPWLATVRSEPRFIESLRSIKRNLDDARPDVMSVFPLICVPPGRDTAKV